MPVVGTVISSGGLVEEEVLTEEQEIQLKLLEVNEYGVKLYEEDSNGNVVPRESSLIQSENLAIIKSTQIQEAKDNLDEVILQKAMEITLGTGEASCQAFVSAYQNRVAFPSEYVGLGLKVYYAIDGYAAGDSLDTELKITEYYKSLLIELDTYRETKIAEYIAAKNAIDSI